MSKKDEKKTRQAGDKNTLLIENNGDFVTIRTRSILVAAIIGSIELALCVACIFVMKGAWGLPWFWVMFSSVILGIIYFTVNELLSKIVLNSPKMTMTVYNPLKKEYKFSDINYIDAKTTKSGRAVLHVVTVYIGDGRRSVEIATLSEKQAYELASLLRGMLDNAAMIYPEGNEEPFNLDDNNKKSPLEVFREKFGKKPADNSNDDSLKSTLMAEKDASASEAQTAAKEDDFASEAQTAAKEDDTAACEENSKEKLEESDETDSDKPEENEENDSSLSDVSEGTSVEPKSALDHSESTAKAEEAEPENATDNNEFLTV